MFCCDKALERLREAKEGDWDHAAPGAKGGRPEKRFRLFEGGESAGRANETPDSGSASGGFVGVGATEGRQDECGDEAEILIGEAKA